MPLRPHRNPQYARCQQSRSFPQQLCCLLASFATRVSKGNHPSAFGQTPWDVFHLSTAATQGRLHCTQDCPHTGLIRNSNRSKQPPFSVSTVDWSTPACHCGSPSHLNSQHQPPTGRRKPTPGTSSMCPQRIFRPAFRDNSTD